MSEQVCHICRCAPAKRFPIRRHVGMVFMQRFVKLKMPMCRTHNLRYLREYLLKTLWQGWWGYISFWVNLFVILTDLIVLGLMLAMPKPGKPAPSEDHFAWMDRPLTPVAPAVEEPTTAVDIPGQAAAPAAYDYFD
jgi:hypothetical protein